MVPVPELRALTQADQRETGLDCLLLQDSGKVGQSLRPRTPKNQREPWLSSLLGMGALLCKH